MVFTYFAMINFCSILTKTRMQDTALAADGSAHLCAHGRHGRPAPRGGARTGLAPTWHVQFNTHPGSACVRLYCCCICVVRVLRKEIPSLTASSSRMARTPSRSRPVLPSRVPVSLIPSLSHFPLLRFMSLATRVHCPNPALFTFSLTSSKSFHPQARVPIYKQDCTEPMHSMLKAQIQIRILMQIPNLF